MAEQESPELSRREREPGNAVGATRPEPDITGSLKPKQWPEQLGNGRVSGWAARWRPDVTRIVLVVDDEPLVRDGTADLLTALGCEVITAGNGSEALGKLKAEPRIGLMITDIHMPGLSGYELAEVARRTRPGLQVILLSGRETDGRGFPLVRKPFTESDLTRAIAQTTGGLC
jgi:CheY-like chemotaxis protein